MRGIVQRPVDGHRAGHQQQRPDKITGDVIGQARQLGLFALRTIEQAHDAGHQGVLADRGDAHVQRAFHVQAAADQGIADAARARQALAGQQ